MLTPAQKQQKLAYQREWRERNKEQLLEKTRAYMQQWREKNREHVREQGRKGNARYLEQNREAIYERRRKWVAENQESDRASKHKYYLAHKQQNDERAKKYWREHPEQKKVHTNARRSRFKACTPPWVDRCAIREIYKQAKQLGLSVDHIVPIQSKRVCGLHCPANLQVIPLRENVSKGNRSWPNM